MELWVVAVLMFAVSGASGLIIVWREDVWKKRVDVLLESMTADFETRLRKRDDEIIKLNARIDAILEYGQAGVNMHADEIVVGGDAVGRDAIRNAQTFNK